MSEGVLLLILAYVILTALLILSLIGSRLHLASKVLLVIAAVALYIASYQGWQGVQGWPTTYSTLLPERFLLHASVIDEPDPAVGSEGAIYVWLSDLVEGRPADLPRAYSLSYDKALHTDLKEALRNMRNGSVQLGRVTRSSDRPDRPTDLTRFGEKRERIEFSELPDPALPEK